MKTVRISPGRGEISCENTDEFAYNNIVYSAAGEAKSGGFTTGDYNLYFNVSPKVTATHDLIADPLFVNAAAADFHLQAGSPAIDTGTTQLAPPTDINGTTRPQGGGIDRGAYE